MKNLPPSLPALLAMLLMGFAVPSYADVIPGETATIGFWHDKNGQAVINSFNGGPTAEFLGSFLETIGHGPAELFFGFNGQTNAQVAADFQTAFRVVGLQGNTYAKAFSVALSIYASTINQGFNSTAAQFGFISTGLGEQTYNVGNNGAAFSVPNGTTLTVSEVMVAANFNYKHATGLFYGGDATLTNDLNNVLDGILQKGDIR